MAALTGMQGGYGQAMAGMQGGYNQAMAGMQGNTMYGQQSMQNQLSVRCDKCGWVPENPTQIPKFCPECGDPIDGNDYGR